MQEKWSPGRKEGLLKLLPQGPSSPSPKPPQLYRLPAPVLGFRVKTDWNLEVTCNFIFLFWILQVIPTQQEGSPPKLPTRILCLFQLPYSVTFRAKRYFLVMSTRFKHCHILLQSITATEFPNKISGKHSITHNSTTQEKKNTNALLQCFRPLNLFSLHSYKLYNYFHN